jgi:hypothetical protein
MVVPLNFACNLLGGGSGTSRSSVDWDEMKRNKEH